MITIYHAIDQWESCLVLTVDLSEIVWQQSMVCEYFHIYNLCNKINNNGFGGKLLVCIVGSRQSFSLTECFVFFLPCSNGKTSVLPPWLVLQISYEHHLKIIGQIFVCPMVYLQLECSITVTSHERHGVSDRLFTKQLVQTNSKENVKVSYSAISWGQSTIDLWITVKNAIDAESSPCHDDLMTSYACRVATEFAHTATLTKRVEIGFVMRSFLAQLYQ